MNEMKQLENMCRAVPPPDPQRLARARARVLSAIAEGQEPASGAARNWPRRATRAKPGRRWPGWVPPLAAAAAVAAVIAGTLTVSSALHGPGVTPPASPADGAIAYVVNQNSGTVTPIRTATNTALTPIKVGRSPYAIAITPDGKTAYVLTHHQLQQPTNGNGGASFGPAPLGRPNKNSRTVIIPIRTATNTALTPIKVGGPGDAIAITPDGKTAYVTNPDGVTPIRTATNTALTRIKVGRYPGAIAITPDGKTAYVASIPDTVTPIRTATNTALTPIKVGHSPEFIAITPDGKTAYVASDGGASVASVSGTVTPIRTATNTALAPIKVGHPNAMAITPDGKTAYVASDEGTVTPIRTATNTALAPIKVGIPPRAIAITPDGKTAYVASIPDTVTPIRTATNTALAPIKVGDSPEAIAITPDGKTAYVANPDGVTPIRTATNTALAPIKVGRYPIAIAITTPSGPAGPHRRGGRSGVPGRAGD
jgi:YVTN family beta-propeller protein